MKKAEVEALSRGFTAGREAGRAELLDNLTVDVDYSLAESVLDNLLIEEPPERYVKDAQAESLRIAQSWRRGREMAFWKDIEAQMHRQYRNRMHRLRDGDLTQKESLSLIEGLMNLPVVAERIEKQFMGMPSAGAIPESVEVKHG